MSDAPPKNSNSVKRVVHAAAAAESLLRCGHDDPALILYEQLARTCAGVSDDAPPSFDARERLALARRAVSRWLRAELGVELASARSLIGWSKRFVAALAAVAALAFAIEFVRSPVEVSKGARWAASSAIHGAQVSGELPRDRFFYVEPNYLFHTDREKEPWVLIDLGRERTVSSVELRNRLDCCRERARGVVIDLGESGAIVTVARHFEKDTDFRA